jgi:hypothetical protein
MSLNHPIRGSRIDEMIRMEDREFEEARFMDAPLQALKDHLDSLDREEKYGDTSIADVLDMVDIDIGMEHDDHGRPTGILVVLHNSPDYMYRVPTAVKLEPMGEKFLLRKPGDFETFHRDVVKVMRARWLLLRGYYGNNFKRMSYPEQQAALANFFPNGLYLLPETEDVDEG